jgi:NADPH-dependent 2,4-dienoyl-CoA reductase/sulfur reductase-like enzyme
VTASPLPVAVIGAGPVGLAAAAHLIERGETPVVLEAGAAVGATVRQWSHVRVFSPWRYNVDPVAVAMLTESGWAMPDPDHLPTGRELVTEYLEPLAALPRLRPHLRLGTRVVSVSRRGFDKLRSDGRDAAPFVLRVLAPGGEEQEVVARAVIDASGTYGSPNPLGADGTPARGEAAARDRVFYGIPAVLGAGRSRYAGAGSRWSGAGTRPSTRCWSSSSSPRRRPARGSPGSSGGRSARGFWAEERRMRCRPAAPSAKASASFWPAT